MQEQFETMKNAFQEKIEDLNRELQLTRSNYRRDKYYLEENLAKTNELKDIFLKKLTDLQRKAS